MRPPKLLLPDRPCFCAPPGSSAAPTGQVVVYGRSIAIEGKQACRRSDFSFDTNREYRVGRCHLQPEQGPEAFAAECFPPDNAPGRRLLLWGDSTATALSNGLRSLAGSRFSVPELTSSTCPPLLGFAPAARPNCEAVSRFVLDQISVRKPEVVVISTLDFGASSHLPETIAAVGTAGVRTVVLVGSPPLWPGNLPQYIMTSYQEARRLQVRLPITLRSRPTLAAWDGQLRAIAKASGAVYVSAADRLCSAGACLAISQGEPIAFDEIHLTRTGSVIMAQAIYDVLEGR